MTAAIGLVQPCGQHGRGQQTPPNRFVDASFEPRDVRVYRR
ncbi:MAG: hypothetical protein U0Q03_03760 [Acidimicrobiales bacterium]